MNIALAGIAASVAALWLTAQHPAMVMVNLFIWGALGRCQGSAPDLTTLAVFEACCLQRRRIQGA